MRTDLPKSSLILTLITALVFSAGCGSRVQPPSQNLSRYVFDTQFGDEYGNYLPVFEPSAPLPTQRQLPLMYDPEFIGSENPLEYMYRLPTMGPSETRIVATVGLYKLLLAATDRGLFEKTDYTITLGPGIGLERGGPFNFGCNNELQGAYRGPLSLCLRLSEASKVPTFVRVLFSAPGFLQEHLVRILVLPQAPGPRVDTAAIPAVVRARTFQVENSSHRINPSLYNKSSVFKVKGTSSDGRELKELIVSPAAANIKRELTDFEVTIDNPGEHKIQGRLAGTGSQSLTPEITVNVGLELFIQAGKKSGGNLDGGDRGVVVCTNNTNVVQTVEINVERGTSKITHNLVIPAGKTQESPPIERKDGRGRNEYFYFTIKAGSVLASGVRCELKIFKDNDNGIPKYFDSAIPLQ